MGKKSQEKVEFAEKAGKAAEQVTQLLQITKEAVDPSLALLFASSVS
jgi:hypothetical protein